MKVKDFLNNVSDSILEQIESLRIELEEKRTYKAYKDFEDILLNESAEAIKFYIKPTTKSLPANFTMGSKI